MKQQIKRVARILLILMPFYVAAYLLASTLIVREYGGGLAGPRKIRVFQSEKYLMLFYPLYLVERVVRNRDLFWASYEFNCGFADEVYDHIYLYGDGKYSRIWYDF